VLSLVLCSDGVWDNWAYEDVAAFVMDQSCVSVAASTVNGCGRINKAFMQRNDIFAKQNFGSHADNATCVMLYLSDNASFPSTMHPTAKMTTTTSVRSRNNSNSQNNTPSKSEMGSANGNGSGNGSRKEKSKSGKKANEVSPENSNTNDHTANASSSNRTAETAASISTKDSPSKDSPSKDSSDNSGEHKRSNNDSNSSLRADMVPDPTPPTDVSNNNSPQAVSRVNSNALGGVAEHGTQDSIAVAIAELAVRAASTKEKDSGRVPPLGNVTPATPVTPVTPVEVTHIVSPRLSAAGALVMSPGKPSNKEST
jgi:hypothetical protein